jgi:hypothetical protein
MSIQTKLMMVEGLPGFGKSTTAKLIYDILTENQLNAELFLEGNLDHPADYDGVACYTQKEFEQLLLESGELQEGFSKNVLVEGNDYLLPYRKLRNEYGTRFSDSLLDKVFEKDIYELPLDRHIPIMKNKWMKFVEQALVEDKIYVFETCFIQNPLTIGMVKYGEEKEIIMDYVFGLEKIIKKLNPVIIYVEQDNLEFAFAKAVKERPEAWSTGFIDYYTNQGYGQHHGYQRLEGTIQVLKARRAIEMEIFDQLKMEKLLVNNSQFEVREYKKMIAERLTGLISK